MNPTDQEVAIGELEERVDRLRILYDQYFLGFEKLEPTVPRKDVERRFAILRKEQIRNTAQRYRFNVVTQKYNTYQMYWQRICRQIEEGTFKRHVRRANARFGEVRAREAEVDIDIDVDLAELDVDAIMAEAEAAADASPITEREPASAIGPPPTTLVRATPGTSFVVTRRSREVLDDHAPGDASQDAPQPTGVRPAPAQPRPVALPAGAKPRVAVRRIGDPNEPHRPAVAAIGAATAPIVRPRPAPGSAPTPAPTPGPRPPQSAPTPSGATPGGTPSGGTPGATPSGPAVQPSPRAPQGPQGAAPAGVPSPRRIVVAPPMPANMRPPPSAPRVTAEPPRPPLPSSHDERASRPRLPLPSQLSPKKDE